MAARKRLFETTPVAEEAVAAVLARHWPGITIVRLLKASQNHTYEAHRAATGERFAVRATPDPAGAELRRIQDELTLVRYLDTVARLDGVCGPVPPATNPAPADGGGCAVHESGLTVCVSRWAATGAAPDFAAYQWLGDAQLIRTWGAWLARLHAATRAYAADPAYAAAAARLQRWDQVHDGTTADGADELLTAEDRAAEADPARFGVLHGDCNISNIFYEPPAPEAATSAAAARGRLWVFDWDQAQRGWFELDLAQTSLTATMLAEGGAVPDGRPVPEADPAAFQRWLLEGYEEVAGAGAVDRARFARMLALRKRFYGAFARRARAEGDLPPGMAGFLDYVERWTQQP